MTYYVLQGRIVSDGDAVTDFRPTEKSRKGEAPRCAVCGNFIGMLPLLAPIEVEIESSGRRWGDLAFGPGDQILVSGRLKEMYAEARLTGITQFNLAKIKKARMHRAIGVQPPPYYLASIIRSRATLDESRSHIVREAPWTCEECRIGGPIMRVSNLIVDSVSAQAEDIFLARGLPGIILTSDRFKHLCDTSDLVNCALIPAEQFSFDWYRRENS